MRPIVKHVVTKVGGNFPHPTKEEVLDFKRKLQLTDVTDNAWFGNVGFQFLKEHDYLMPSLLCQPLIEMIDSKKEPALAKQATELVRKFSSSSFIFNFVNHDIMYRPLVSLVREAQNLDQTFIMDFDQTLPSGRTRRILESSRMCYLRKNEADVLDVIREQTRVI
jgi:hypothetical protein